MADDYRSSMVHCDGAGDDSAESDGAEMVMEAIVSSTWRSEATSKANVTKVRCAIPPSCSFFPGGQRRLRVA